MTDHIYPAATYRKIPAVDRQPQIAPRAIILHSAAGKGSLYQWWLTNPQGLESHFWIGEDGRVEQYVPCNVRADANGQANAFAISIETESTVQATEPWTPAQLDAIHRLLTWACDRYGIPRHLMPNPDASGIAWHVQFGAPGPWTSARGKTCPGPARIRQVIDTIIPRLNAIPTPSPPSTPGGLTMSDINEIIARLDRIEKNGAQKAVAFRDPRDKSVWILGPDGYRRPLPNPGHAAVTLEAFVGVLRPGGEKFVHPISAAHLDLIPIAA